MKAVFLGLASLLVFGACAKPEPLTKEQAEAVIRSHMFVAEPVYAEVPQKVVFGPASPKDDFDELSVRTLRNLERAGLVTVEHSTAADGTETYVAKVTKAGFSILGTTPSNRGPAFRGRICEKRYTGFDDFARHPSDPTIGRIEIVWHYVNPTNLYPLFETKIDKPLQQPFMSVASVYWNKGDWRFNVIVQKTKVA
jgi:hypothetical protein